MNAITTTKEIGIEAILIKPRIVFTAVNGDYWVYTIDAQTMADAENYIACGGRNLSYYVTCVVLDVISAAPDWVRESGIFSFFGPGRAAIREAIETTLTANLAR